MFALRMVFPAVLALAACAASPAPEFFGAKRMETVVEGRKYVVYQKDNRVEVVRLGHARNGEHARIRATMIGLIEPVTGCTLNEKSLQGDSGEMRGTIRC
jgi:hypothetical protein